MAKNLKRAEAVPTKPSKPPFTARQASTWFPSPADQPVSIAKPKIRKPAKSVPTEPTKPLIHHLMVRSGESRQETDLAAVARLKRQGWTVEQRAIIAKLGIRTAGVQIPIILADGEDEPPAVLKPFQSIEDLSLLCQITRQKLESGEHLTQDEGLGLGALLEVLLAGPDGPKLLTGLREFRRDQAMKDRQRFKDRVDIFKADIKPVDADVYDTPARTLRRKKARLKKS